MKTRIFPISELNPAPYNPRIELRDGMEEWDALNESLDKFGLVVPIVVNERNNIIISGHQRIAVLKAKGAETVEAVVLDLDDGQEKQLNIALNKIEGRWDFDKLEKLLEEMTPEEKKVSNFLDEDIEKLRVPEKSAIEKIKGEDPFDIYVSFDNKDDIPKWLEDNGLEAPEITSVTVINMALRREDD